MNKESFKKLMAQPIKVAVPEFGEGKFVTLKPLTFADHIQLEKAWVDEQGEDAQTIARIKATVAASLCDESGNLMFSSGDELANTVQYSIVYRCYQIITQRFAGLSVDALVKNS